MAETHIEEHSSPIKTPGQLITVVLLAFLVPVLGIILLVQLIVGGLRVDMDSPAMSEEAVAKRLKPVGRIALGEPGEVPAAIAGMPSGEPPQVAAASPEEIGAKTYQSYCTVCHGAGIAGAPKTGDKAAWEPRIAQGKETLYASAINGKNAMPPKGGALNAPDADIKAAVDYMVERVN
ncbi:MAG: c-type cytochrome [Burkholderiales bacterium]